MSKNSNNADNAIKDCRKNGMKFLSLETEDEMNFFLNSCDNTDFVFNCENFSLVGGKTFNKGSKEDWFWMETGEKIEYTLKFASGEPDNVNNNEECLSLLKENGKYFFNDINCVSSVHFYICEALE